MELGQIDWPKTRPDLAVECFEEYRDIKNSSRSLNDVKSRNVVTSQETEIPDYSNNYSNFAYYPRFRFLATSRRWIRRRLGIYGLLRWRYSVYRNNATIKAHVKILNRVKHRVWHTDPWPDLTKIADWLTGDPETSGSIFVSCDSYHYRCYLTYSLKRNCISELRGITCHILTATIQQYSLFITERKVKERRFV